MRNPHRTSLNAITRPLTVPGNRKQLESRLESIMEKLDQLNAFYGVKVATYISDDKINWTYQSNENFPDRVNLSGNVIRKGPLNYLSLADHNSGHNAEDAPFERDEDPFTADEGLHSHSPAAIYTPFGEAQFQALLQSDIVISPLSFTPKSPTRVLRSANQPNDSYPSTPVKRAAVQKGRKQRKSKYSALTSK